MKLKHFLGDRLILLIFFVIFVSTVLLVYSLSLIEVGLSPSMGNLLYMIILAVFLLIIFFLIDYFRHKRLYQQINRMNELNSPTFDQIDALMNIQPITYEQQQWINLIKITNAAGRAEVTDEMKQREQYEVLIHQWVHQMKTPVSVISLIAQEGKTRFHDHHMKHCIEEIEEENDKFRRGLDIILHGARVRNFAEDITPTKMNLVSLVKNVINDDRKQFIKRGLYPKLITKNEQIFIYSDEKWLRFAISQVLYNALKYSVQGNDDHITFEVIEKNKIVKLNVIDHGVGIPRHDLKRVFQPFFTGENGRHYQESTGMGLYLVKEICTSLGHTVSVDAEPEKGTTVSFTFESETLHGM
ncbi:sensor histidine kinase [Evansella halocellulosilytica]|uniref:sensor histidine kinase n=1 Tax=Evansella halocellulosilytica TaxID=2011013 RepID=UPI000BB865A8|nr:sensor histidine kinase [Evansella halocellulosilytica]